MKPPKKDQNIIDYEFEPNTNLRLNADFFVVDNGSTCDIDIQIDVLK